ncbi:hypothetical protein [Paenibacillus woosongensis]|uniref:Uncharacterized protein n=1 Tax=Paenibacillus woosongensis TaxID=307580 RepID=A0A7X2Z121_9BACL|nr:hypothetical protein [Paenibacillus woosongensis]MUG45528.1 hypothetical protein [Paenibacillus woosongensis]
MLGKTQHEIENEYYFVDLPELLMLKDQNRASELLENIDVVSFPHISDKKAREAIVKRYANILPKPPAETPKSAEEQYQAQLARMKGR